jgi:Flp pilus assembly protein TadD
LDRAVDAARHAIAADPNNGEAHMALAVASWFKRDYVSFSSEAARALELNPNDPMILYEVGVRRYLRGDEQGLALVKRALAQGSGRPDRYHDVLALDAYMKNDYARALEEASHIYVPDTPLTRAVMIVIYGKVGRRQDAAALWDVLARQLPQAVAGPHAMMLNRGIDPRIADALMNGLYEAGVVERPKEQQLADPIKPRSP